jgi:acetyl-CoA carboxylase biotin carboxyl carrier protein
VARTRRKKGGPRSAPRSAKGVKSAGARADNAIGAGSGGFALSEIRQLIRIVQRTGIGELEVTSGGRTVRIAAHGSAPATFAATPPPAAHIAPGSGDAPGAAGSASRAAAPASETLVPITSPMVGTFYRAPAPDADPYIEVGDIVEVGQTVCIVEAMKLMNEIESEARGRVVQILAENAQPVEFGQKLFLLEPV